MRRFSDEHFLQQVPALRSYGMGNVIANVLGAELIVFCIIAFVLIHWGKKLDRHLLKNYPKFFEENLAAPFWAGDWNVVKQHLRALKNTYWGIMPDETSSFYQSRLRWYAKLSLISLSVFFITLITVIIVSLVLKGYGVTFS